MFVFAIEVPSIRSRYQATVFSVDCIKRPWSARARADTLLSRTTMVLVKKKKVKHKAIIQRGVPSDPSTTVKTQDFKRSAGSRLVSTTSISSSRSSVPLTTSATHESVDNPADAQLYSDIDEEELEREEKKKRKKERKGPSRSVNMSTHFCSFVLAPSSDPASRRC